MSLPIAKHVLSSGQPAPEGHVGLVKQFASASSYPFPHTSKSLSVGDGVGTGITVGFPMVGFGVGSIVGVWVGGLGAWVVHSSLESWKHEKPTGHDALASPLGHGGFDRQLSNASP